MTITISNSRINLFRRCKFAHYVKYHLNLIPKKKGGALQRGTVIHECLENWNSGKSWMKPLKEFKKEFYNNYLPEEIKELGDLPKMVEDLMKNYTHYYNEEPYEVLFNELHFELPLIKGVDIQGYIDCGVRDQNNNIWSKEYKSYARVPKRGFLIFNIQSGIYSWALEELGYKTKGFMWDIIKAKQPTKPKLTKQNKLSLAKLDSTPLTVKEGIIELGFKPENYIDFINKHSYEDYLIREEVRMSRAIVKSVMEDVRDTAKQIKKYTHKYKDKNLGKDCSWCQYRSICQASLLGLDVEYVKKANFKERD